jgi:putative spermidine/putrescine transport system ATP-binding protein
MLLWDGDKVSGVNIKNVTKTFGNVFALDDISLEIETGELVALLGPSGCGKTTLLRTVAGLEQPDKGVITINGKDVTNVPTRGRPIGMVFQNYALFPNLSVWENIAFPLEVRKVPKEQVKARVNEIIELIHLTKEAGRYPNQISGGQQQRAALGRALAPSPQVLLLDEPLSALDALVRVYLREEIRRIQQRVKITTLYVTHDQGEAMAIADRVAVMNKGTFEQIAPPSEIYERPSTCFSASFVGNRNAIEMVVTNGKISLGSAFDIPAKDPTTKKVLVFIRPEDLDIQDKDHGQPALVETKIFQGYLTRTGLAVEVGGQLIRIYADINSKQAESIEVGSTVNFSVKTPNIRVFPVEN